jgi:TRAP-type uncharacterized transport system fused permease subunit
MHSLAQAVESVGQQILPLVLAIAALLLLAYQFVIVRDVVLHLFTIARGLLDSLADALDGLAATLRRAFQELRRHVTDDERIPLPRLIVAVVALAPILFLLVVVEVRLWGPTSRASFPSSSRSRSSAPSLVVC